MPRSSIAATLDQIRLVKPSFAHVVPVAAVAADAFYARLFELAPQVRPLFRNDMETQRQKLIMMIATVVAGLDNPERIIPAVEALAIRHVGYGTQDAHYDIVGEALLGTLEDKLGAAFTPEVKDAWVAAYDTLAGAMIAATRKAA